MKISKRATRFPHMGLLAILLLPFLSVSVHAQGVFFLQLGSYPSREQAESTWQTLLLEHQEVLGPLALRVSEVALPPDNYVIFRTQAGPVDSREDATAMCERIQVGGRECHVVETAMYIASEDNYIAPSATSSLEEAAQTEENTVKDEKEVQDVKDEKDVAASTLTQDEQAKQTENAAPVETPPAAEEQDSAVDESAALKESGGENASADDADTDADALVAFPWRQHAGTYSSAPLPKAAEENLVIRTGPAAEKTEAVAGNDPSKEWYLHPPQHSATSSSADEQKTSGKPAAPSPANVEKPKSSSFLDSLHAMLKAATAKKAVYPHKRYQHPTRRALSERRSAQKPHAADVASSISAADESSIQSGTVEVTEAIRVPLTEAGENIPSVSAPLEVVTTPQQSKRQVYAPTYRTSPSLTGRRELWIQIGYFSDKQDAIHFWERLRERLPGLANPLRVRVTHPYAIASQRRLSLRVGPVIDDAHADRICGLPEMEEKNCTSVQEVGSSAMRMRRMRPVDNLSAEALQRRVNRVDEAGTASPFWVQLGTYPSIAEAEMQWKAIKEANETILRRREAKIVTPPLSSSSTAIYRLRTGPFISKEAAHELCNKLRYRDVGCLVVFGR